MPNGLDLAVAIYGVLRAGAAFCPINPTTTTGNIRRILADLGTRTVICEADLVDRVRPALAPGVALIEDAELRAGTDDPDERPMIGPDLGAVIYTSGSTGEPKGVTLTHGNMSFVADSIIEYLEMNGEDRILCVLPLSFGYGLYQLLCCVRVGATLVLEPGFGAAGRVVQLFEDQRITGFPAVPTIFQVLLSLRGLAERPLPDLRFVTNAGAGLPEPVVRSLRAAMPNARIYLMYGQTECQRVCYLPPDEVDARPTSVGIAIPGTEAWVEDGDGRRAAPGAVGELVVRGPHVMQGYWAKEEATSRRLREGRWPWERELLTGDLFRCDEDGYLYFVSRRDDIIKSRGEKVAPREVEEVIHAFEGIQEAAVVGVPDRLLGEAVHAHIAPRPDFEVDVTELLAHCAQNLEPHKVPKRVLVHERLPRIGSGKIDRRALRAGDERDLERGGRGESQPGPPA
jgi:acyl-CoA synthetase (AMP-forming)/AMP-acid ligase II